MVTSNEPGLYREGMHGIRHENVLLCREAGKDEFGDWLEFETLTLCHIDTSAVIADMLSRDELKWLNGYNERVYRTLSPLLPPGVRMAALQDHAFIGFSKKSLRDYRQDIGRMRPCPQVRDLKD